MLFTLFNFIYNFPPGFALKAVSGEKEEEQGTYDSAVLDVILVLLFSAVMASGLYIMVRSLPCCAPGEEEEEGDEEGGEEGEKEKNGESEDDYVVVVGRTL